VNWDDGGVPTKIRKGVGIAASVTATSCSSPPSKPKGSALKSPRADPGRGRATGEKVYPPLEFGKDLEKAVATAKEEGRPMMIDFGASWCVACGELEKHTFADKDVKVKASRFVAVKFDASNDEDPKVKETMTKYNVKGLPAVILLDNSGNEVKRLEKFIPANEFLTFIEGVSSGAHAAAHGPFTGPMPRASTWHRSAVALPRRCRSDWARSRPGALFVCM
jgi:thiol:disulfide interchange protein DsbD